MFGILLKLLVWVARFLTWAVVWAALEFAFNALLEKGLPKRKRPRESGSGPDRPHHNGRPVVADPQRAP